MNRYERFIDRTRHLIDDLDKFVEGDLDTWVALFVQEAISSGLYLTTGGGKPSGGLIVILAIFGLKDPERVFARQFDDRLTIYLKGNGDSEEICLIRLKNLPANPKASLLKELGALGAPAGLFKVAEQVVMNMRVFYEMPG